MGSRHALEVYDPSLARKQQQLASPPAYQPHAPPGGYKPFELSDDAKRRLADALARETEKLRVREEERRRRDPTYNPHAIELNTAAVLGFDKYVDYYATLDVDQFASAAEIRAAYKKLSLALHPDKQSFSTAREREQAVERFHAMTSAYNILSDLATRRQYDQARDNLEAGNEAGLVDVGKVSKPPPTCVDVELTLEQLFKGCRKSVEFTRHEFAGTKWAKTSIESFTVKVNKGELDGAAIWYRNKGDVGTAGRADLVFVVKQTPHETFERLGDDLWYYHKEETAAEKLFFVEFVPVLHVPGSRVRRVVAVGSTLLALLGIDRSQLGEAIVPNFGMPIRDNPAGDASCVGRTRGDLVVKFPIRLPPAPRRLRVAAGLPMPPLALITSTEEGELPRQQIDVLVMHVLLEHVLRYCSRARATSQQEGVRWDGPGSGAPRTDEGWIAASLAAESEHEDEEAEETAKVLGRQGVPLTVGRRVKMLYPRAIGGDDNWHFGHVSAVFPEKQSATVDFGEGQRWTGLARHIVDAFGGEAIETRQEEASSDPPVPPLRAASRALERRLAAIGHIARASHSMDYEHSSLRAACVRVGGMAPSQPGDAARGVMEILSQWLPQLEWRVLHMVGGVEEPLLADEEQYLSSALICLVDAAPDASDAPPREKARASQVPPVEAAAEEQAPLRASSPSPEDGSALHGKAQDWMVCWSPGVRSRRVADVSGEQLHVYRQGELLRGTAASNGWIRLAGAEEWVLRDGSCLGLPEVELVRSISVHERAGLGEDTLVTDTLSAEMARIRTEEEEQQARDALEQLEDEEVEAEELHHGGDAVDLRYLAAGCTSAQGLMQHPSAASFMRCHCNGGLVIAVDEACSLFGQGRARLIPPPSKPSFLTMEELAEIQASHFADDLKIDYDTMRLWSRAQADHYFATGEHLEAQPDSRASEPCLDQNGLRLTLPYLVGLQRAGARMGDWSFLRAAAARSMVHEGVCPPFTALGLPCGSVVAALPSRQWAVRPVLGSAAPYKLSRTKLSEWQTARDVRRARQLIEVERHQVLRRIEEEQAAHRTVQMATSLQNRCAKGLKRGHCPRCNGCDGFSRWPFGPRHPLADMCSRCGCKGEDHELLERAVTPQQ
ncbi:hypothetical protein AB1Y20_022093 [Prymnesium parvum]|uniref:J domain-containing protein n=1 Tax=Prymnesium parvum TaxID=97485 RepID=A0AB34JEV6_PRYPA